MSPRSDKMLRTSEVTALRSALVRLGIFIYEYKEVLGNSWSLIVRKGDTLVRFFWDGRDGFLMVDEAAYIPSSSEYLWRPTDVPKVDVDETQEPLRYIEEVLKRRFCA